MNKYIITGTVAAIAILAAFFGFSKYFGAAPQLAGGVVAADRMNYSTIDGNTGSTTASVIGGAFVSPTATSTLIAGVSDIDYILWFNSRLIIQHDGGSELLRIHGYYVQYQLSVFNVVRNECHSDARYFNDATRKLDDIHLQRVHRCNGLIRLQRAIRSCTMHQSKRVPCCRFR